MESPFKDLNGLITLSGLILIDHKSLLNWLFEQPDTGEKTYFL